MSDKTVIVGMLGSSGTLVLSTVNVWLGCIGGVITIAYVIRKWYLMEKENSAQSNSKKPK